MVTPPTLAMPSWVTALPSVNVWTDEEKEEEEEEEERMGVDGEYRKKRGR